MNAWIIEKNPLKNHYLKKKIFMVTQAQKKDTNADYKHVKRV